VTFKNEQRAEEQYEEKRELVFQEYVKSLDLEVAMAIVPLSDEHTNRLLVDEELLARVSVCEARFKSELVEKARTFVDSANEGVARSTVFDLGEMFYPKRFKKSLNLTGEVALTYRVTPRKRDTSVSNSD
jgi:hypothetical protein